ncbi:hypothetical protein N9N67_10335 [Bacteriovoracaceae bacterium]|nr:hypothetical protein [Bacteriovoracaceae bacterium]
MNNLSLIIFLSLFTITTYAAKPIDLRIYLGVNNSKATVTQDGEDYNLESNFNSYFNFFSGLNIDEFLAFQAGYKQYSYAFEADSSTEVENALGVASQLYGQIRWKLSIISIILGFSSYSSFYPDIDSSEDVELKSLKMFNWKVGSSIALFGDESNGPVAGVEIINKLLADDIESFLSINTFLEYAIGNQAFSYFLRGDYYYESLSTEDASMKDHILLFSVGIGI